MTTLRQRWDAWTAANLDRCPHETGVVAARRRAAGEEPECTSVTVAHLRPGVLALCWNDPAIWSAAAPCFSALAIRVPRFPGMIYPWESRNTVHNDRDLQVLP